MTQQEAVIGGHAADVGGDFHDGAGVVLGNGAKAGAMIGVRQIVINCFGDADDAHFVAAPEGFLMDFIGGVLRIVAAGIKEIANVVGLKHLEKAVHVPGGLFGFLFEINLVSAGAEGRSGGVFESFDGFGPFLAQINQMLVENAEDAVPAAINMGEATMMAGLLHDARHAGIDDGGGASGLGHQKISN